MLTFFFRFYLSITKIGFHMLVIIAYNTSLHPSSLIDKQTEFIFSFCIVFEAMHIQIEYYVITFSPTLLLSFTFFFFRRNAFCLNNIQMLWNIIISRLFQMQNRVQVKLLTWMWISELEQWTYLNFFSFFFSFRCFVSREIRLRAYNLSDELWCCIQCYTPFWIESVDFHSMYRL